MPVTRTVCVTGAAGFVGRHLVAGLLAAGHSVKAIIHRQNFPSHLRSGNLEIIPAESSERVEKAIEDSEIVCHLAAHIPRDWNEPSEAAECLRVNALLTLQLAETACKGSPRRFIYFSAGAAYSFSRTPVAESACLYPVDRATYYLASKLTGEIYVEHHRRARRLPALILRVGSCYGPGMPRTSVVSRFLENASNGLPIRVLDGGVPTYDFVHVSDVVGVTLAALETGNPGVYNVGAGTATSVLELACTVREVFDDREVEIVVEPTEGVAPCGFSPLSNEKAGETWGYSPLPLKEGLLLCRQAINPFNGRSDSQ